MPAAKVPPASALRERFRQVADPARALRMQAYLKSAMPCLGVSAPLLRQVCKESFRNASWPDATAWRQEVLSLWRAAEYREERHVAIELSGVRQARAFQDMTALTLYEEMIVTGGWWDYVDTIAVNRLWPILQRAGEGMKRVMLQWSQDSDMWKRRSAFLCQNGARAATDVALLHGCIEPSLGSQEFFLRKAIGWSLRQHARTDPEGVRAYVEQNHARLSPLSRREALKHLDTPGGLVR